MSDLRQGWMEATVSDLAGSNGLVTDGDWIESKDQDPDGEVRLIQLADIGDGDFRDRSSRFVTTETAQRLRCTQLEGGDLLVARMPDPLGRACIYPGLDQPAITAVDVFIWRGQGDGPDARWLMHTINSPAVRDSIAGQASGTTRQRIAGGKLKQLSVAVPPLPEQRRIVAKIDSLTGKSRRARDHLDHIPRLVEKYKQAVLAAAFRGDLTREWRAANPSAKWSSQELAALNGQRQAYLRTRRGSRLHSNGEAEASLPNGWFSAQLSDVGALQVGYAYKSKWYAADGVRLLRGANVAPGIVSWDDEVRLPHDIAANYSDYRLDAGDIVIAMDRPIISTGLKVARISGEDAGCLLVQRVARYAASELVDRDYVWHLISSQHFIDHAVTQATGSDLPHISSNDILTTPVPLPCLSEQREIARRIGTALSWIDRLASEATSARRLIDRLDQSVLAKALRGELVPQDPEDEPASVLLDRIRAERGAAPKIRTRRKAT